MVGVGSLLHHQPVRWTLTAGSGLLLVALGLALPWGHSRYRSSGLAPESASGWETGNKAASSTVALVVAAHPLASQAGLEILRAGGHAVDAAVAVQAVLTLVEPQSSGIGGGGFAVLHDARTGTVSAWDGRETAPADVSADLFLDEEGRPMDFFDALVGGRSVGTPGIVAMLAALHDRYGRLPWGRLFEDAIQRAESGFEVTPRLSTLLALNSRLRSMASARLLYYPTGRALRAGQVLKNPELARTLRTLASDGPRALYEGELTRAIVAAVRDARQPSSWEQWLNTSMLGLGLETAAVFEASRPAPGTLSAEDFAAYRAVERRPVCLVYRSRFEVCGAAPPSSGGLTVLQILGLLERFPLSDMTLNSPEVAHLIAEASRLAFADRDRYIADPDFVDVPEGLLERSYLERRSRLIDRERAIDRATAGVPPGAREAYVPAASPELPSTSHMSIVDRTGNVLSLTTSVEFAFGSGLVVGGFILNNQLTDFSFAPTRRGKKVANRVEPRKRPRSSMSPMIVRDRETGRALAAVGSPGGSRIIGYVAHTLIALLDFGVPIQTAVELPKVVNRNGATEVDERGWSDPQERSALVSALEARGHTVKVVRFVSGLHAAARTEDVWYGGADPRREGVAVALYPTPNGKKGAEVQ